LRFVGVMCGAYRPSFTFSVAEITYLIWGDEGLQRYTVFAGLREAKPASEVRRESVRST
jgi:hypothetical protein